MSVLHNNILYRAADAHAHIYPHKIADKATAAVGNFYDIPMQLIGSSETLLKYGRDAGIDKYLVCSVATKAEQVEHINKFIQGECENHPEFVGFAAFHQDLRDFETEIEKIVSMGFKGIKLHPDFQKFYIDDEKMLPAFKLMAEAGLTVLFHMGDDRYDFSDPERLLRLLQKVPDIRCIAAHFGGYRVWRYAYDVLNGSGVYIDCSSSLDFITCEFAREMVYGYGVDRCMFGTDFPMWTPKQELENFFAMGLSREENEKVLYTNFENLLLK